MNAHIKVNHLSIRLVVHILSDQHGLCYVNRVLNLSLSEHEHILLEIKREYL